MHRAFRCGVQVHSYHSRGGAHPAQKKKPPRNNEATMLTLSLHTTPWTSAQVGIFGFSVMAFAVALRVQPWPSPMNEQVACAFKAHRDLHLMRVRAENPPPAGLSAVPWPHEIKMSAFDWENHSRRDAHSRISYLLYGAEWPLNPARAAHSKMARNHSFAYEMWSTLATSDHRTNDLIGLQR